MQPSAPSERRPRTGAGGPVALRPAREHAGRNQSPPGLSMARPVTGITQACASEALRGEITAGRERTP